MDLSRSVMDVAFLAATLLAMAAWHWCKET